MVNLILGDCLTKMQELKPKSVDLILTDLPYGTTACVWDSVIPLDQLWQNFNRVAKKDAAIVLTCAMPFTAVLASSNIKHLKYEWIWEKPQGTNPLNAKYMPLKAHENILVFCRGKMKYNPQMEQGTPYGGFKSEVSKIGEVYGDMKSQHRDNPEGDRYPKTVLKFKQEKGLHPTQKPVPLFRYLVRTYTDERDTVLDCTMGSGTTGVACQIENRNFIGIEQDKEYFEVATNRLQSSLLYHMTDT